MFYDYYDSALIGRLTLVGDNAGLRHIEFARSRRPLAVGSDWQRDAGFFHLVREQLDAYFAGELQLFSLELAPEGTQFQQRVWNALRAIPYGTVVSYRDIAEAIGNPGAVRAVGGANARNPLPIVVPCHRVIGSDGTLTGFGGGLEIKQRLLDLERGQD